jgi:hypothetical protein
MTALGKLPCIDRLVLPGTLPRPEAMASLNENLTNYDPEFWELEYVSFRYLENLDEVALRARYDSILRNMQSIVSPDRHVIPIRTFLSSWYWYRKEHQTRAEFVMRGLSLHIPLPEIKAHDLSLAPARPGGPNRGDVLFRYGERKWLKEMVECGHLRIKAAREYALMESDPARQDDELTRRSFSPGKHITITFPDGKTSKPIGDLKRSVSGIDYFVYCVANEWDPDLFADFKAEACVVIRNPDEFAKRLKQAAASLSDWYFHYNAVQYFDPYERTAHEYFDNAMSKDFRFAYQRETRFLWAGNGRSAHGFIDLELEPLHDIATYTEAP